MTDIGSGSPLDQRPELLFLLRSVDQQDLIAKADTSFRPATRRPAAKVLESGNLSQIFGIEIAQPERAPVSAARRKGMASGTTAVVNSNP